MGYIAAPAGLTTHFKKVSEWMNLICNYAAQRTAWAALTGTQDWVRKITSDFERHRDTAFKGISGIKGVSSVKSQGGPFLFLNISQLGMGGRSLPVISTHNLVCPPPLGTIFSQAIM